MPRPDIPLLYEETTILLDERLENGADTGWRFDGQWTVQLEGGEYFLAGQGPGTATPDLVGWQDFTSGWSDFTLEAGFKRIEGSFELAFRQTNYMGLIGYFLRVDSTNISMDKQVGAVREELSSQVNNYGHLDTWLTLKVVVEGSNVKLYINGLLLYDYTDEDTPILWGTFALDLDAGSTVYFDDMLVTGIRTVQRNQWVPTSDQPYFQDIGEMAVDPRYPDTIYAATPSGAWKSRDFGENWDMLALESTGQDRWYSVAFNPENPDELLLGGMNQAVIAKSTDGGDSWRSVFSLPALYDFSSIAYAPSDPSTVYAGMGAFSGPSQGMYRSDDGGESWREINDGLFHSTKNITDIIVHPTDPDVAYIATQVGGPSDGLFKTVDGGENWVPMNNGLFGRTVLFMTTDTGDPDLVYAGLERATGALQGDGVFATTDGGKAWNTTAPSVAYYPSIRWDSVHSVVIDPEQPETLYAANGRLGVSMSNDGGATWAFISEGLSGEIVQGLVISADGRTLYANVEGHGAYRLHLW